MVRGDWCHAAPGTGADTMTGRSGKAPRVALPIVAIIATLLASMALPGGSTAQSVRRVGVLTPAETQWQAETFRAALRELGWAEGTNLGIELRSAEGRLDRLPALARDLVDRGVDVIVAINTPGVK